MKTGNVILAIFLWIVAGTFFYYFFKSQIFGGSGSLLFMASILSFLLGCVSLYYGTENEETQKSSSSFPNDEKCQRCGRPRGFQQFYFVDRKFICEQCADEVTKKSSIIKVRKNEEDESVKVLKLRYAKGEITKEQYDQMKMDLED